jgi:hypothetical protein
MRKRKGKLREKNWVGSVDPLTPSPITKAQWPSPN